LCAALDDAPLVMTSGNPSHEPIAYEESDARARVVPLADRTLTHNRAIFLRCDDSVVRVANGARSTLRRARGLSPRHTPLGRALERPLLALGAHDNVTFALGRGDHAIVSHHLGDLSNAASLREYRAAIAHYESLFCVEPKLLVHDLHPDYATTEIAREIAAERGLPLCRVQHHHAHIASSMVEHSLEGSVLGVAWDGTGYGEDGSVWGGEFLLCSRASARRVAHLRVVAMPGGERAIREPWRMALAQLRDAELGFESLSSRIDAKAARTLTRMLDRDLNCPRTSSAGRLFDAVSALCGVVLESSYEGQAAIELEWQASRDVNPDHTIYAFELCQPDPDGPLCVDTRPLVRGVVEELARGGNVPTVARRFHLTLAHIIGSVCAKLRARFALDRVVFGGGVFANALLLEAASARLEAEKFQVFWPQTYPAGDGGLSLGQLAVAAARDHGES
ncbi:MAG TPA: Sua5/YciO/YrdC/YwlC family protein, partial [Polyangiaceae bacterium]